MAFTTLAFAELFHMLGVSNLKRSFVNVFKNKNLMMLIAFISGIVLQILVIQVGPISAIFNTRPLDGIHWLVAGLLSVIPLIAHELIVLIKKIIKK
jgi:Ca2+-transporting ATPase